MTRIVGIDPGLNGALAVLQDGELIDVWRMPTIAVGTKDKVSAASVVELLCAFGPVDLVVVEFVNAVYGSSASAMFTFGQGAGIIEGALCALERPWVTVKPPAWTKAMNVSASDKGAHREAAARLFPSHSKLFALKRDDGRADAALIAEYGRRIYNGGHA